MKKKLLLAVLSASSLMPSNVFALVGTAVREVVNYAPGEVIINDSNSKVFIIDAAKTFSDGSIKPEKAFYTRTTDIEIKQNAKNPTTITLYNKEDNVVSEYTLADYDWRIWHVKNLERTSKLFFDKTHLKTLYKTYRKGWFNTVVKFFDELFKDESSIKDALGTLDADTIKELADKPPTKDTRLYILPDGSAIMGPDNDILNIDSLVQNVVNSKPELSEGETYADRIEEEVIFSTFTEEELEELEEIEESEKDELVDLLEQGIDASGASKEEAEDAINKMIESAPSSQELQIWIDVDAEGAN